MPRPPRRGRLFVSPDTDGRLSARSSGEPERPRRPYCLSHQKRSNTISASTERNMAPPNKSPVATKVARFPAVGFRYSVLRFLHTSAPASLQDPVLRHPTFQNRKLFHGLEQKKSRHLSRQGDDGPVEADMPQVLPARGDPASTGGRIVEKGALHECRRVGSDHSLAAVAVAEIPCSGVAHEGAVERPRPGRAGPTNGESAPFVGDVSGERATDRVVCPGQGDTASMVAGGSVISECGVCYGNAGGIARPVGTDRPPGRGCGRKRSNADA